MIQAERKREVAKADTRVQLEVEDWVRREWMPKKFGQQLFRERVKLSSVGVCDFDAVSGDHKIVAPISTSGALTATSKYAVGKMLQAMQPNVWPFHGFHGQWTDCLSAWPLPESGRRADPEQCAQLLGNTLGICDVSDYKSRHVGQGQNALREVSAGRLFEIKRN